MTAIPTDLIEKVARALCEARTWPGAWERANEVERNAWLYDAQAALTSALASGLVIVVDEPLRGLMSAAKALYYADRDNPDETVQSACHDIEMNLEDAAYAFARSRKRIAKPVIQESRRTESAKSQERG